MSCRMIVILIVVVVFVGAGIIDAVNAMAKRLPEVVAKVPINRSGLND